jgi:hypothetical protein
VGLSFSCRLEVVSVLIQCEKEFPLNTKNIANWDCPAILQVTMPGCPIREKESCMRSMLHLKGSSSGVACHAEVEC